jgi:eukaryotic-like serine/threonine-protein kinase
VSDIPQSTPDFLKTLRASGLVPAEKIDPIIAAYFDETGPVPEPLVDTLLTQDLITRWQLGQLRKGKSKGFTLGKYTLRELLGAGGMGSVYLARHTTLGSDVAIKVLPTKRVQDGSYLERFKREAQAASRLSHPNIARVIDLDSAADGKLHFMVMEYIDGIDLHAKVKQGGPLDVAAAVDCVRQAALGLHEAHEHGFVHRDIKPANLMLDVHGAIKVLDLGLAKTRADDDDAGSLTMEFKEKTLGTADYVAPEQATDSHRADRRADVYSLGCTLYYLIVGTGPFAGGSIKDRLKAQIHTKPPSPLEKRPDVPADLVEFYFRMMQKDPAARPQTAREVADTLQAWLAKHGGAGRPGTAPQRQPVVARRSGSGSSVIARPPTPPPSSAASQIGSQLGASPLGSRILVDDSLGGSQISSGSGLELSDQSSVIRRREGSGRLPPGLARPPAPRSQPTAVARVSPSDHLPAPPAAAQPGPPVQPASRVVMRKKPSRSGSGLELPGPLRSLGSATLGGQPLALWILLAIGLLVIVVLAVIVFIRAAS